MEPVGSFRRRELLKGKNMAASKKRNPFVDEGEGEGEPESPVKDPVLELSDDDDDDPIDAPTPSGPTREDKRKNRAWMNREDKDRLERENQELKARADQAILQAQQATTYAQQAVQYSQQNQPRHGYSNDPIDHAAGLLARERKVLNQEYQNRYAEAGRRPISAEEQQAFEARAEELEQRNVQIGVARALRAQGLGQHNPQQTQADVLRIQITQKYPEASQHQAALVYADGVQKQLVATGAQPYSQDTIDKSMDAAERQFRLGKYKNGVPQTPSPQMRERLQGSPRGGGSGGGEKSEGQVVMTKEMRKMANAAYGHIKDEGKRYKAWYKSQAAQSDE